MISKKNFGVEICIAILALAMALSLVILPMVVAHAPPVTVSTWVYAEVVPNPTGLNQPTSLIFRSSMAPPGANDTNDVRWKFFVTLKDPNGTVKYLGLITSDIYGRASRDFNPYMTGNWSVTVEFVRTTYLWDATAEQLEWTNDTFAASSYTAPFVVQSDPVPDVTSPFPEWYTNVDLQYWGGRWDATVQGNRGGYRGHVYPELLGPDSPHVMWTKPLEPGGVVGGQNVGVPGDCYYMGLAYNLRFSNIFAIDGKLYYRESNGNSGEGGGFICVDIRTGKELFSSTVTSISHAYRNGPISLFFTSSNFGGNALDPNTLQPTGLTVTGVPTGTWMYGPNGEFLRVALYSSGGVLYVRQWNSSKAITPTSSGAINASNPSFLDFNNVPITYEGANFNITSNQQTIRAAFFDDVIITSSNLGTNYTFWAISLKPETRGQITWNQTYTRLLNETTQGFGPIDPVNRIITIGYGETMQYVGYNFETGEMWGPTEPENAFAYYSFFSGGATYSENPTALTAYGKLYSGNGYAGIIYCRNMSDGKLLWTYGNGGEGNSTKTGLEAVWGNMPTFISAIADGKIYTFTNEHSPNTPLYKGAKTRCIDANTGREIWKFASFSGYFTYIGVLLSDDYLIYLNVYDGQIYCIGKGPSSTSVAASSEDLVQGNPVLIKGTVMDSASGTLQHEQAARFQYGVPAAADKYMAEWMEYVYLHRPRPADFIGVDVKLTAIGSNGEVIDINTVTTDSTGFFSYVWKPDIADYYIINATFAGSESYLTSSAQVPISVKQAPSATPTPTATPQDMTETYVLSTGIIIIVIILVAGALIILKLRKMPNRV